MIFPCGFKTLFNTINRIGTGTITNKELTLFYITFLGAGKLGEDILTTLADQSHTVVKKL